MKQSEIKLKSEQLQKDIKLMRARHKGELTMLTAQLEVYQDICEHPNGYETSCMGETGFYCPDCKYSR